MPEDFPRRAIDPIQAKTFPGFSLFIGFAAFLLTTSHSLRAEDKPYVNFVMERITEGLQTKDSKYPYIRMDGAYILSLYADTLNEKEAPDSFIIQTAIDLEEWLDNEDNPWIRHLLVEAIGNLSADNYRKILLSLLDDPNPTVRARAAEFLDGTISAEEEKSLIKQYSDEKIWWVRTEFLLALGRGTTDLSLKILHDALNEKSRDIQAAACYALGERKDPRSVQPLVKSLGEENLVGEDSPAWALAKIGNPEAIPSLEKALSSPYPLVRLGAAYALGKIGEEITVPVLEKAAQDPDWMVQKYALEALGQIGGKKAATILLERLENDFDEDIFYSLLRIEDSIVISACDLFLQPTDLADEKISHRRELCDLVFSKMDEGNVVIISTGEGHSIFFSPFNSKTRRVWPERGNKAIGWEDFIGRKNRGEKRKLKKGEIVTIWSAASFEGETWLEVTRGPYDRDFWIRETDLKRIPPEDLKHLPIFINFGADSRGYFRENEK